MANKLSFSQTNMYSVCPKKYYYHYKERLREKTMSSALLWGTAIDNALTALLQDHKRGTIDYLAQEYDIVFTNSWRKAVINGEEQDLISNENLVYAKADFDPEIILKGDFNVLAAMCGIGGEYYGVGLVQGEEDILELYKSIGNLKEAKGWENLESCQRKFYNHLNWLSMHRKATILIRSYIEKIVPQIKEVLSTQEMITLTNEDGDEVVGFIDAVLRWVDNRIVIVDHKTAAREYDWDAVLKSPQLSLYMHSVSEKYENTRTAGFIVLRKNLDKNRTKLCSVCNHDGTGSRAKSCDNTKSDGKRCGGEWIEKIKPEGRIDVLINEIPHRTEEIVMENMADINHMIKQELFTRNMNACSQPFLCPYINLCYKGDSSNLVKLNKK